jgi:AmiR/NasT family two-component response regulator
MRKTSSDLAQRHRVSQAQGMVSLQAHCAFGDALAMMNERAKVHGQTLLDVADAVLSHRMSFNG